MKKIRLFLLISLGLLSVNGANADDNADVARAATRRDVATTVVSTNRQQSIPTTSATANKANQTAISRYTSDAVSAGTQSTVRDRATVTRSESVNRSNTTDSNANNRTVSARTTSNVQTRTAVTPTTVVSSPSRTAIRNATTVQRTSSRTSTPPTTGTTTRGNQSISRSATQNISRTATPVMNTATARRGSGNSATISRSTTNTTTASVLSSNYTKCRDVYYSCMDEFCANKDSQLKRCACSSRVNEFDSIKKQLSAVEDKMLDFNQRLLTVNMDKEDASALFQATEGELAFQQEDTSESKKLLDEIAKKLNTTFDDSTFNPNLSPISLSLNADAAFDNVDSLMGSSTTTKTGPDLYSAALPVCREMALEVCSQDELDIAESGYQMAIEQDCNTVAKSYATQQDKAREKIREGSALLDMSRLDIYQKRNSDDILTCKKKMLDMLTDTTVCGEDLGKCLDISGRYIDPSTGEAILTTNLVNLGTLITRPETNQTWTGAPGNEVFVSYLNSKKKFLEPAMEKCQDIADYVWDAFIEDALAQIKLAQEQKLEDVRQSCTTLTTQCLTKTSDSLEDFDARALSIFGVKADKTVREMCAEVQNSCTALLNVTEGGDAWNQGMTEIATDKTYDTILKTCREVGRACIIQSCKSISGNFGLCENIQTSVNRKAIINRTSCWDEVVQCVADAGVDSINNINQALIADNLVNPNTNAFYESLYGANAIITNNDVTNNTCINGTSNENCIYDICASECGLNDSGSYTLLSSSECKTCRIAERIWGNCEAQPATILNQTTTHNKIKIGNEETLLSWFAKNTNTAEAIDSCRDTSCGPGFISYWDEQKGTMICISTQNVSDDGLICPTNHWLIPINNNYKNCCKTNQGGAGLPDVFGNCCGIAQPQNSISGLNWDNNDEYCGQDTTTENIKDDNNNVTNENEEVIEAKGLCLPESSTFVVSFNPGTDQYYNTNNNIGYLICVGTLSGGDVLSEYPNGQTVNCDGYYVFVNKNTGKYISPKYEGTTTTDTTNLIQPINLYRTQTTDTATTSTNCIYKYNNNNWSWSGQNCAISSPTHWTVTYQAVE